MLENLFFNYYYDNKVDNGIPILNFYDNKEDRELLDLKDYLMNMLEVKDVREYNKQQFKLK